MSRRAEDASGGGRCIGRQKMRWKAEEASEAEAEFEMERRGGRGFPLQPPAKILSAMVGVTFIGPKGLNKKSVPTMFCVRHSVVREALQWLKENNRICKGNPLTPLCFTVPSASDPPSTVCLVFRGMTRLPRYNSTPTVQLISRGTTRPASGLALYQHPAASHDITRHHATYHDVPQSPRYLAPPASLPLPTRLSRDIQRHPVAPASVASVPSLGYPTTSRDPVASPAAPCEIQDTTTSSGPSHYPPTSLPSDPTSPVTRPALPHAFRIPLPTCTRSRPAAACLPRLLCSVSLHARFPLLGFSLFPFMFCT